MRKSNTEHLSYRDVLHARGRVGRIDRMCELARRLGYPYFVWGEMVYRVAARGYADTGIPKLSVI